MALAATPVSQVIVHADGQVATSTSSTSGHGGFRPGDPGDQGAV